MAIVDEAAEDQRRICEYGLKYWLCPASRWQRFEGAYVGGHPCKYADVSVFGVTDTVYCNYGYTAMPINAILPLHG